MNKLLAAGLLALAPALASAQAEGGWRYRASIYGYFPSFSGHSNVPADGGGTSIDIDSGKVVDSIDGFFMGAFEAHNGRWGLFTDYMYLSLGGNRQNSRDFSINGGLDASTSADLGFDLTGTIWTLAGEYRLPAAAPLTADVLAGARMFRLKRSVRWNIAGSIGTLDPLRRSGSFESSDTLWDAVVGVKGRYAFGSARQWVVPFYLDAGTGDSRLTWQASTGIGYAFSWGEVSLLWRYLSYEMKSGNALQELKLNGPMVGATFTF
ncbi:hypothetical protein LZ009_22020 [Ramlibacter sp. XY19]|uniref:hypothetical protein n=1 Tax=Ramlibacter paludis TaxID=2908000 RepID=UPI0023DA44FD|nr:hypothetical protein [Ramlibacter paludis]MCG2595464.1 hypothetical protein [Ramlibacter paludis]